MREPASISLCSVLESNKKRTWGDVNDTDSRR